MNFDWFTGYAKDNFSQELKKFKDLPNLNYLQIGAFMGEASYWLCENVLTNTSSRLTDIDCWDLKTCKNYMSILGNNFIEKIESEYDIKIEPYKHKINKHKSLSKDWLLNNRTEKYDFIYIDGDHSPQSTMVDGILSWDLLNPGGILVFDDYLWDHPFGPEFNIKSTIDMFINMYKDESQVILSNWQVWLKKL